jgi:hypothetical protein
MRKYRKFIVAAVSAVLIGLSTFAGLETDITAEQIATVVIAVGGALGVWAVPNSND